MAPEDQKPQPERDRTDESLRTERRNTDRAIEATLESRQENTDELIDRSRRDADATLQAARDGADRGQSGDADGARARDDEVVRRERALADESLRRERAEQQRVLSALLPLERDKTDRYLLTERRRSDSELSQRDDFLGIVSHDLRNLLSGIVLSANALVEVVGDGDRAEPIAASAERILRYGARMNRLIGDLVDVVSIDAGKLAIQPARIDVGALIDEAVDAFAPAASMNGIALVAEASERPVLAELDRDRMFQVLANLIANAVKFTPRGGRIAVAGVRAGDELRISVSDTGSGIPDDLLEVVFERFWQVGKDDRRGLGLGLYIARCIVEAHGGRIWAESTPGKGSAFRLAIPRPAPTADDGVTSARSEAHRTTPSA